MHSEYGEISDLMQKGNVIIIMQCREWCIECKISL